MDTSTATKKSAGHAARLTGLMLATGAISLLGTAAMAQSSDGSASQPSVTVKAPRVIHRAMGAGGMSVAHYSLVRRVSFADLNLNTPQGQAAFHERIRATARAACRQLETRNPSQLWIDDVQTCVNNAMLTWMPQVHAITVTGD